ncbi:uncharacterized protein VTP21DRAFT_2879 [Calcarisporiella thermophila]|uniref:uncharacterized protein n=1 Tax=Calcarisporiella thermophila TaxID=911321 RepID=UPI00374264F4
MIISSLMLVYTLPRVVWMLYLTTTMSIYFHLDHIGSLPFLTEKSDFKGRVFMTPPTKSLYKTILADYLRISAVSNEATLFTMQEVSSSFDRIETIRYREHYEIGSVRIQAMDAGHALGAAMFLVEIEGVKVLYTGDFSCEEGRFLAAAEFPNERIDVIITESTFGVRTHDPRVETEYRFIELVENLIQRGGNCLIPATSLGQAQDLLYLVATHPKFTNTRIYYACPMGRYVKTLYEAYVDPKKLTRGKEFLSLPNVLEVRKLEEISNEPCVVIASPAMLQNGISREIFEAWASDPNNGVIITGFCVKGTLARDILDTPSSFQSLKGHHQIPLRCSVYTVSFLEHVDFPQNLSLIQHTQARCVVLVHGEANRIERFKNRLKETLGKNVQIGAPGNGECVRFYTGQYERKMVKTTNNWYEGSLQENQLVNGILVSRGDLYLTSHEELQQFNIPSTQIAHRLTLKIPCDWSVLVEMMRATFGAGTVVDDVYSEPTDSDGKIIRIMDQVNLRKSSMGEVEISWASGALGDVVGDSIVALVLSLNEHQGQLDTWFLEQFSTPPKLAKSRFSTKSEGVFETEKSAGARMHCFIKLCGNHFDRVEFSQEYMAIQEIMGASQSAEGPRHGYHVMRVKENSPAEKAGIEPFFDFIIGINGLMLDQRSEVLTNTLKENIDRPVSLVLFSTKEQKVRETTLIPSYSWHHIPVDSSENDPSLIGCSIRFCAFTPTLATVWHVLEVHPDSPAAMAGLSPHTDYIIGTPQVVLRHEEDLYSLIEESIGRALQLYVYNSETGRSREVVVVPNREWGGGESALGCGIGFGLLHRIPTRRDSNASQHSSTPTQLHGDMAGGSGEPSPRWSLPPHLLSSHTHGQPYPLAGRYSAEERGGFMAPRLSPEEELDHTFGIAEEK